MFESFSARRGILWALRALILVAVIAGVHHTFQNAIDRLDAHDWRVRADWLAASATFYILGLVPTAWFWHRALVALGQPVPWRLAMRAHFLGHLGKYVPGKALVVVLRVGTVRPWINSTWLAVMSVFWETLIMMAVGAFLAAGLAVITLPLSRGMTALAIVMAVGILLPTFPPVARKITRVGLRRFRSRAGDYIPDADAAIDFERDVHQAVAPLTWKLWADGWVASLACWTMFGLSLWAMLRAVGIDSVAPLADLPFMIGAVSLAVVAGFLSFLPGGLVVRDALLLQLLTPICGESNALVVAVLLRVVWLVSELLVCAILYGVVLRSRFR